MKKIKSFNLRKVLVDELGTFARNLCSIVKPLVVPKQIPEPLVVGLEQGIKRYELGVGPKVDKAGTERSRQLDGDPLPRAAQAVEGLHGDFIAARDHHPHERPLDARHRARHGIRQSVAGHHGDDLVEHLRRVPAAPRPVDGAEDVVGRDGAVVEEGAAQLILRAPQQPYTRALLAASDLGDCRP